MSPRCNLYSPFSEHSGRTQGIGFGNWSYYFCKCDRDTDLKYNYCGRGRNGIQTRQSDVLTAKICTICQNEKRNQKIQLLLHSTKKLINKCLLIFLYN